MCYFPLSFADRASVPNLALFSAGSRGGLYRGGTFLASGKGSDVNCCSWSLQRKALNLPSTGAAGGTAWDAH